MSTMKLVPVEPTEAMCTATGWQRYDPTGDYKAMLAAAPPIPRPVFNAMVEAGAGGLCALRGYEDNYWPHVRVEAEAALLAALGNPEIADE